jgi:hypothetical protein
LSPAKYSHVYNHAIPPWARLSCSSSHFLTIPQYRVLVSWAVERLGGPRVNLQKRSGKKQTAAVTMVVIQMKGRVHRGFWGRGICVGGGGGGRGVAWAKPAWRARKEALRPVGWSRRRVAGISPSSSRLFRMKKSLFIWRRWGCLGAFEMGTIDEEERKRKRKGIYITEVHFHHNKRTFILLCLVLSPRFVSRQLTTMTTISWCSHSPDYCHFYCPYPNSPYTFLLGRIWHHGREDIRP